VDVKRSSATSYEHPNGRRAVAPVGGVWGSLLLCPNWGEMLRYRRVDNLTPESGKLRWHGIWTDQYGNLYTRTLVWHPGFWWFVLFAEELEGMRMQALKFYWKDRRSYIGGNKRA
jgi:hypothetical protein